MVGDIASMALNLLDRYIILDLDADETLSPARFRLAAVASLSLALKFHDDERLNNVRMSRRTSDVLRA